MAPGSRRSPPAVAERAEELLVVSDEEAVRAAFVELQALSKQWMEKEREGISLIESFQTALLATRNASTPSRPPASTEKRSAMMAFVEGAEADITSQMDPWLAEDLFAQIQELPEAFTELLERIYSLHNETQKKLARKDWSDISETGTLVLTIADYAQFIASETATFEAEYQHIEALLAMISFAITTDQLRTLVISWSTSPFLDPEQSRQFRQRHEQSQKMRP